MCNVIAFILYHIVACCFPRVLLKSFDTFWRSFCQKSVTFVSTALSECKGRHTRRDQSLRLVPATSPRDQVPSCELAIFIKNLVAGTKFWFLRLVPRIQTMFEFPQIMQINSCLNSRKLCRSLRVNCSWDKSLRPNENKPIADLYFHSQNASRTPFQDGGRR